MVYIIYMAVHSANLGLIEKNMERTIDHLTASRSAGNFGLKLLYIIWD